MKTHLLSFSELWHDFLLTAGIIGIFTLLGFYSHQFAFLLQANFFTDWGLF